MDGWKDRQVFCTLIGSGCPLSRVRSGPVHQEPNVLHQPPSACKHTQGYCLVRAPPDGSLASRSAQVSVLHQGEAITETYAHIATKVQLH